jgi:cobalt-zinc-cadmium efflux system outer membrane protein
MYFGRAFACILAFVLLIPFRASAESSSTLTLTRALQRALAVNPRLTAAEREVGVAAGRRVQAGAVPNPEASFELDNAFGTGDFRGLRSADTTLQLSHLIELGGRREARVAAGSAELDATRWERAAVRLEGSFRHGRWIFHCPQRTTTHPNLRYTNCGARSPAPLVATACGVRRLFSPAEVARAQLAVDLVRADRERAATTLSIARRELTIIMGASAPDFSQAVGDLNRVGTPPAFQTVLGAIDSNPQLIRWTAIRAQRDAELLLARLKPIPDLQVAAGWRHFGEVWNGSAFESNNNAVRLGVSVPLPVWDQNLGAISAAQESRAKVEAVRASNRLALILSLGRAYDTLVGAAREIDLLRASAIPNGRKAIEGIENGYNQGRFSLLELLDAQNSATQATLRELEALINFHTSVATIEGLAATWLSRTSSPLADE